MTMCARAVRETFFKLFKDGLIYRGKRLVNWDVLLQTSISDDEIYHETVKTSLVAHPLPNRRHRQACMVGGHRRARKPCWATPPWPCIREDPALELGDRQDRWICR